MQELIPSGYMNFLGQNKGGKVNSLSEAISLSVFREVFSLPKSELEYIAKTETIHYTVCVALTDVFTLSGISDRRVKKRMLEDLQNGNVYVPQLSSKDGRSFPLWIEFKCGPEAITIYINPRMIIHQLNITKEGYTKTSYLGLAQTHNMTARDLFKVANYYRQVFRGGKVSKGIKTVTVTKIQLQNLLQGHSDSTRTFNKRLQRGVDECNNLYLDLDLKITPISNGYKIMNYTIVFNMGYFDKPENKQLYQLQIPYDDDNKIIQTITDVIDVNYNLLSTNTKLDNIFKPFVSKKELNVLLQQKKEQVDRVKNITLAINDVIIGMMDPRVKDPFYYFGDIKSKGISINEFIINKILNYDEIQRSRMDKIK